MIQEVKKSHLCRKREGFHWNDLLLPCSMEERGTAGTSARSRLQKEIPPIKVLCLYREISFAPNTTGHSASRWTFSSCFPSLPVFGMRPSGFHQNASHTESIHFMKTIKPPQKRSALVPASSRVPTPYGDLPCSSIPADTANSTQFNIIFSDLTFFQFDCKFFCYIVQGASHEQGRSRTERFFDK